MRRFFWASKHILKLMDKKKIANLHWNILPYDCVVTLLQSLTSDPGVHHKKSLSDRVNHRKNIADPDENDPKGTGPSWPSLFAILLSLFSGWVVTWLLFGYTAWMFEYTVWTFWLNVSRFLYVFSSIFRKLYSIFQPTFFPIKRYQNILFKLLWVQTLSQRK